ncbi:MAG: AraC family transcriptional regulator [Acholeplasmatales bacterium]|nr:AraC family transcriptional regulator [Acholeplasmatales bacterium]
MGVLQAHGLNMNHIKNYNSIFTLKNFSIAEYHYVEGRETLPEFSHNHKEYEFIIPLKTIPLLVYDKACYIGEVGYIYPVNPFTEHGIVYPLDKSACIDITIDFDFMEEIKSQMGVSNHYFYTRFNVPPAFMDVIREFQNEYSKEKPDEFRLENLARLIATTMAEVGLSENADNRRPEKKYRKNIKQMILYMYNNFQNENLDIADLAEMSGYSVAYFTKAFKAYMNDTPVVHLNKLRISEAKALMYAGDVSCTDIYKKVGYRNLSSFTEAFKRVTGLTPSAFKETYIGA